MSIEAEKPISRFKDVTEKGEKLIRKASPFIKIAGAVGIIYATATATAHLRTDKEARNSIELQVSEARPRIVTEEQYRLAQRENAPDVPQQIDDDIQLIKQEDERSQQAAQLKDELTKQYKSKVSLSRKINKIVLGLSLGALFIPFAVNSIDEFFKKHKK